MQIVIPMSGSGERFKRAGYDKPKPLIEVEGKPIFAHVVGLFPGEKDFIFICREDHLSDPHLNMVETIKRYCKSAKIIGIPSHKLGPVHAVLQAADAIKVDEPTIVSYCDFSAIWDYPSFKRMVESSGCDGALMGYTGFHPHMLRNQSYGYVRMEGERVVDIREKQPYTDDPMSEIALAGAYYFRKGSTLLEALRELEKHDKLRLEGEHYISLAYKFMLDEGADIHAYLVSHFMQWGTPEDLQEYLYFSNLFHATEIFAICAAHTGYVVMPMAGRGQRFVDAGFDTPKPLLSVAGNPMALQALQDLPETPKTRVVLRRDLAQVEILRSELPKQIPNLEIIMIDQLTEGQALTALKGLEGVGDDEMVTIAACDSGAIYNAGALNALLRDVKVDVIVWGARGYPYAQRNPQAYGWVNADDRGEIKGVLVKSPLKNPERDPIITGTFTFRRAGNFRSAVARLQKRDARVNGEFYIDEAINDCVALGLNCRLFITDFYEGWGSPNEYKTYNYWAACFGVGKSFSHPRISTSAS